MPNPIDILGTDWFQGIQKKLENQKIKNKTPNLLEDVIKDYTKTNNLSQSGNTRSLYGPSPFGQPFSNDFYDTYTAQLNGDYPSFDQAYNTMDSREKSMFDALRVSQINTDQGNNKIKLKKSQRQFNAAETADRYNDLMEDYQDDGLGLVTRPSSPPDFSKISGIIDPLAGLGHGSAYVSPSSALGEDLSKTQNEQVSSQLLIYDEKKKIPEPITSYTEDPIQPNQFISESTADKINQSMSTQRIDTGLGVDPDGNYSQGAQDLLKSTTESFGEKNSVAALGEKHLPTAEELADSWGVKNYAAINAGLNMADKLMGSKSEYSGAKGGLTKGLDSGYDAVQSFVGQLGPVGKAAGLFMGANKLLAKGLNKIGGGTDGMTSTDAIMGSNFLAATPVGMINGFGGKRANSFTKFNQIFEQLGSDYTGTDSLTNRAAELAGKKFGLASNSERHAANRLINNADVQQRNAMQVGTNATNMFDAREGMYSINENKRIFDMTGANNMTKLTVGRNGMSFKNIDIAKRVVSKHQQGGKATEETPVMSSKEAKMFKSNWGDDDSIIENIVPSHKEGGLLEISLDNIPREYFESYTINEISLDSILPEYKEGGKFNVIPDGALHARLHHMDNDENITKKGIPVVSEGEGGELEQHAEIEREEIIFRLEVTEKIEELLKKYTDSSSQDEKDNIAIEAGKLLADEILNNTQDNTGLLTNIK